MNQKKSTGSPSLNDQCTSQASRSIKVVAVKCSVNQWCSSNPSSYTIYIVSLDEIAYQLRGRCKIALWHNVCPRSQYRLTRIICLYLQQMRVLEARIAPMIIIIIVLTHSRLRMCNARGRFAGYLMHKTFAQMFVYTSDFN